MRRFPQPWTVEAVEAGFKVIDSNGQSLAYVYGHADKRDAETAKLLGKANKTYTAGKDYNQNRDCSRTKEFRDDSLSNPHWKDSPRRYDMLEFSSLLFTKPRLSAGQLHQLHHSMQQHGKRQL